MLRRHAFRSSSRETIKTDATGKASLTFDTPRDQGQDFDYSIEARVTDASRREITANGTVRVTRQRYYVDRRCRRIISTVRRTRTGIDFKALDANDQPVVTEGTVKVTRERWVEIWLDSKGREVQGDELKAIRNRSLLFPPPPIGPDDRPWHLKFRGYRADEILTRTLKTDTNGEAQLDFTPEREGFYRVAWTSPDNGPTNARPAPPIETQTTVWVANDATTELGYRQGGVEIIVDRDTFRVGQTAPVMLSVPANDRYVLFTVEGEDLYNYQLVHVTGTVKLVELPVEERHVPNIFLSATLVSDHQIFHRHASKSSCRPSKNFLPRSKSRRTASNINRARPARSPSRRAMTRTNPSRQKWPSAWWMNRSIISSRITPATRVNNISARNARNSSRPAARSIKRATLNWWWAITIT